MKRKGENCWWECKLVQQPRRTVWSFLERLETEWPYDPAAALLAIYSDRTAVQKGAGTTMFTVAHSQEPSPGDDANVCRQ